MAHIQYELSSNASLPLSRDDADRRAGTEYYSREQVLAGIIVVAVMSLSLFGLVFWHDTHRPCWTQPNPDRSCASDHRTSGETTWSPGGIGSAAKSTLLQDP